MAYTLKASGLATGCIAAVVVDEDGTTVKDIATGATGTLEGPDVANGNAQATIAAGTWNGVTRNYINVPGSANAAIDFGASNLNAWAWATATPRELTVIFLLDDYASSGDGDRPRLIGNGDGAFYMGRNNWGDATFNVYTNSGSYNFSPSETDRQALVLVLSQGQVGPAYVSVDGANVGANVAGNVSIGAGALTPRYVGRDSWSNKSGCGAKIYAMLVFDTELSTTDINTVVANPWTTLFEEGGTSVAPLAHAHYTKQRNS